MKIDEYINQKRELCDHLRHYIENVNDESDVYFQNLFKDIENKKILESREELKEFCYLLLIISKYHQRYPGFIEKIVKILIKIKDIIKQTFSNLELFNLFESGKLILLHLFNENVIEVDQSIYDRILAKKETDSNYFYYFYPKIKSFIDEEERKSIENDLIEISPFYSEDTDKRCMLGENDSRVCELIRNNSVDAFASYMNESSLFYTSKITPSVFETNSFLTETKETTLIEYAAFCKSDKIFQYLRDNKVELTPSLWIYAIHGRNTELIHLLEDNKINPPDMSYEKCLEASVKCHHNEIVNYILINFLNKEDETSINEKNYEDNIVAYSFHYHNYSFMPKNFDLKYVFCYLCEYNYLNLVELLLQSNKSMINTTIICTKQI